MLSSTSARRTGKANRNRQVQVDVWPTSHDKACEAPGTTFRNADLAKIALISGLPRDAMRLAAGQIRIIEGASVGTIAKPLAQP
jgi:hypothetical protein